MPTPTTPPDTDDATRLLAAAAFVRDQDSTTLLRLLLPGLSGPSLRAMAEHCHFAHAAVLVFPPDQEALHRELAACGLAAGAPPTPSTVVRDRLALRHGHDAAGLDVAILRPPLRGPRGEARVVEVFALAVPPGSDLAPIAAHERAAQHEAHLAFEVGSADPLVLDGLCALLARHGASPDGGGYNPHEDGTVLYFTAPAGARTGYRRLELHVAGAHPDTLAAHLGEPAGLPRADAGLPGAEPGGRGEVPAQGRPHRPAEPDRRAETLLHLLTGAWTTQALAVSARLGVPDALDTRTGTGAEALAHRIGAHPESLATLLRYLVMLDVVAEHPDGFRLTGTGELLRADAPGSMRPLALMYGGPFYRSFGELGHTVRTGQAAFDHLFGENHFDHFARDPELAELFDRSMAASARMFEPLPAHPVLTAAGRATVPGTVVDVAGGNGELLGRVLTAHPRLRGVLLERPHAVAAARGAMDAAGFGARCTYVTGDFADVPPDADVYLLSRVLHDWDDERCREILGHLARAMPARADLLIVERVLPADGSTSLATAWDLHMMCNTGGRERRADHFARLLADAGLELVDGSPLPLGATVLHARKAAVPAPARSADRVPARSGADGR
ncbi:methyltransferase [Kitasatospora sp. NPDC091207]|uniref:methyltransferase n=1 Tax=Kitasatospora sp. NPDC091207 TaxID=3364083 RepID=UPI0037FEB083